MESRVNRGSWKVAFDFVVEAANLAMRDPNRFVDIYVVQEINKMLDGLRKMITDPKGVMDAWLARTNRDKPSKYITVHEIDESAERIYACYPSEMLIDFKARKISYSLDFLDSLKSLKSIYGDVEDAIKTIKNLAMSILPDIESAKNKLTVQISGLQDLLGGWKKRCIGIGKRLEALRSQRISWIENRLMVRRKEGLLKRIPDVRKELASDYDVKYPSYCEHTKALDWCDRRIRALKAEIKQRQSFADNLKAAQNRIVGDNEVSHSLPRA